MRAVEDFHGLLALATIFGMHRNQDAAVLDLTFVLFRLILGDSQSDQSTGQDSHRSASRRAAKRGENRTSCDEWSNAGNREAARSDQPSECASQDTASDRTGRRAFGRLGVLLMRKVAGRALIGKQHRDVFVAESCGAKLAYDIDRLVMSLCNTDNRLGHDVVLRIVSARRWCCSRFQARR